MHKVTLNWKASAVDALHDAPNQYEVQRAALAAGPWTTIATIPADQLTFIDTDVKSGEVWFYQTLAKNDAESGPSNEVQITVPFLAPGSPSELVAIAA